MVDTEIAFMQMAYEQACLAVGLSSPNPRVGCVLVQHNQVVGVGYTQAAGQAHAEVMAIRDAQSRGMSLSGCTVFVTLEPCSHFGRTPPCVDALLAIVPSRVVVACLDANPIVAGRGVDALRAAGIVVEVLDMSHSMAQKAYDLNVGFMHRMLEKQVYTRLKLASSIDGKSALLNGQSQWITGKLAREDGQCFRARADAIVTGVGTVLHDNPQLNVRVQKLVHPPHKYVIDTWLRTPLDARLFDDGTSVYLVCADVNEAQYKRRKDMFKSVHPNVVILPVALDGEHVDLKLLWAKLCEMGYNEIHVEAGATLNAALLQAGLVDELLMYIAPRVLGAGLSIASFSATTILDDLRQKAQWRWLSIEQVGDDLRLRVQKLKNIAKDKNHY